MTIKNLAEANKALLSYANRDPRARGKNYTLERIYPLMEIAGNPQDRLRVVHIAGTSGKTSTAYYMAALLKASGKKIGLTVSPHIDSVTERIQINGKPLSEEMFCRELGEFLELVQRAGQHPSYFELLYTFSLWIFDRQGVDYAVLETGVGGLYDATNVTSRPDKVCIITDIGFDHMHLLGDTLAKIAAQKIGIVHKGNAVFMYKQSAEAMEVIKEWVANHHATLTILDEAADEPANYLERLAAFQRRNWRLANSSYSYLAKRDSLKHLTRQELQQTQEIQVPGRMDKAEINGKTIIMDGAHNVQKMAAFIHSFQKLYSGVKPAVLLSLKHNKDHENVAPLLVPFASRFIVTMFDTSQDLRVKSMEAGILASSLRDAGAKHVQTIPDQREAFKALLAAPEKVCVVTGSFYLIGQLRNNEKL